MVIAIISMHCSYIIWMIERHRQGWGHSLPQYWGTFNIIKSPPKLLNIFQSIEYLFRSLTIIIRPHQATVVVAMTKIKIFDSLIDKFINKNRFTVFK
jgi:hypothetical protein